MDFDVEVEPTWSPSGPSVGQRNEAGAICCALLGGASRSVHTSKELDTHVPPTKHHNRTSPCVSDASMILPGYF